jgi:hypothetical protein
MNKNKLRTGLAVAAAAAALGALAQTPLIRPSYQYPPVAPAGGPAQIQVGSTPFFFTPSLGVAAGHDDNVFLSHADQKSSTLYVASPGFKLDARSTNKVLQLSYQAQVGRYTDSHEDDYVDHAATGQFDIALGSRNFLRLGLDAIRGHDPRGSTDRPLSSGPDEYRLINPYATYALGAPGAAGRVELYANRADRRYLNNRDTTEASDRDVRNVGGTFYWRAMPKTYLLVEARDTDIDYARAPGARFSANERRYFGGVSWEATAATTGTLKVGRLKRDFKSELPDESASSWEGTVTWAPRTYSKFELYTVRTTTESTGLGAFILTTLTGVTWNHAWNSYFSTGVDLRYQKDQYRGFDRLDETKSLGFKVGYRFRRWLTIGGEFTHTMRDSNIPAFEYDRNIYLLTATASL